jgi:tetratricopeptide (TPR) repeat protein
MQEDISMNWRPNALMLLSILMFCFLPFFTVKAQKANSEIRKGVKMYDAQRYDQAAVLFKDALKKDSNSFDASYDLGNALYRQKNYKAAMDIYQKALPLTKDKSLIAKDLHNIGNAFMQQKQYEDALKAYRSALLANPNDDETRFNYAYAAEMLKHQQNKQNQNKQNKQNKQNQQNKQDNKNQNQQNNNKNKNNNNNNNQNQQQPQGGGMSKQNAEQILNSIQQEENQVQNKINQQRVQMHSAQPAKDW